MNVTYLHTNPCRHEIDNLILDISGNVNDSQFIFFEYPYLWESKHVLSRLFNFRKFLKKNKIDVVHTYDFIDAYLTLFISKGLNIRVVLSDYSFHDNLKSLRRYMCKSVYKKVSHLVFQSEEQKNHLLSLFKVNPDKCSKLFHAFCMKRLDNCKFNSIRDEFFIDDFRYLIGTMGDFTPERDVMSVFKMVKQLRKTGRNFTCVVSGGQVDEYDSIYNDCKYYYLIQGLDNYITYIGKRNDDANVVNQLDGFVYCSQKESVAIPVIEAMISGTNVIVNDCDMIREITSNGKYATLFESGNINDFASKTRDVLLNLEDNRLISEVVKEETRDIFSINKHISVLISIYSKICDNER